MSEHGYGSACALRTACSNLWKCTPPSDRVTPSSRQKLLIACQPRRQTLKYTSICFNPAVTTQSARMNKVFSSHLD